jgi:hypothetical protein
MSMSVMIADKSVPFAVSLAGALRSRDVSVALISDASGEEGASAPSDSAGLADVPWNRPSALSARTVPLAVKNRFGSLDQAILVFDTPLLEAAFPPDDSLSPVRVADEYIRGYMLLVRELGALFAAQEQGRFAFVLRVRDSTAERSSPPPANLPVSVAEAAFIRLAEETALSCGASKDSAVQSLLVRMENQDDSGNLLWLTEQLMTQAGNRSSGGRWIKAGTRGLFGKF